MSNTFSHKIEFGFGTELDRNGNHIENSVQRHATQTIRETACQLFGGCTMLETWGGWKSPEGHLFRERGAMLVVYMDRNPAYSDDLYLCETVKQMAQTIKDSLNQQAVAVIVTPLSFAEII